ncbi:hypothetical protein pdam_00022195 [Pocillopora damicornis]|uniref:Uncharacterized protein n=1 Tax=Pocillopora damicornis TaxID=46731 RepID=A0A3M6UP95_POCDA|nr:hypothetical protein pdam_00022195 [Pocillopora damicornis]
MDYKGRRYNSFSLNRFNTERYKHSESIHCIRHDETIDLGLSPCPSYGALQVRFYMHFPPGSNNRLNDAGENNTRLSDSQNNDKCGYNVGDKYDDNPRDNIPENRQEPMEFYMSRCYSHA